jgi:O-antigen/teichoic acid export membrane protein
LGNPTPLVGVNTRSDATNRPAVGSPAFNHDRVAAQIRARSDDDWHPKVSLDGSTALVREREPRRDDMRGLCPDKTRHGWVVTVGQSHRSTSPVEPEVGARPMPKVHFSGRGTLSLVLSRMWQWTIGALSFAIASRDSLARRLVAATICSAGLHFVGRASTFLVGVQLARSLGPAQYGIYGTVMAIAAILGVPAQLGLPQLVTRELSAGDHARGRGAVVWFTLAILMASAVIIAVGAVGYAIWPGEATATMTAAYYWGLIGIPLTALLALAMGVLRGYCRVVCAQSYDYAVRPGLLALFVFIAARSSGGLSAASALILQAATGLLALVACAIHVARATPREIYEATLLATPREWARSAVAMTGTEILRVFDGQYAILILGFFVSLAEVGQFRVALAMAAFIALPSTIINLVIMPHVAKLHAEGEREKLSQIATASSLAMFVGSTLLTLGIFLVGKPTIAFLFGPAFAPAWLPLVLMGIACMVSGFFGASSTMLNMCGGERTVATVVLFGLVIGVLITLALAPALGITAAAIAMIASEAPKAAWMSVSARGKIGVDVSLLSPLSSPPADEFKARI